MNKKLINLLSIGGLAFALSSTAIAAENEVTITGDGACSKCVLKESGAEVCAMAITVGQDPEKQIVYHLADNPVSKEFAKENKLCAVKKKVKAIGKVELVDGKWNLTASKIDLVPAASASN